PYELPLARADRLDGHVLLEPDRGGVAPGHMELLLVSGLPGPERRSYVGPHLLALGHPDLIPVEHRSAVWRGVEQAPVQLRLGQVELPLERLDVLVEGGHARVPYHAVGAREDLADLGLG